MLYINEEVESKIYDPETGNQTSPFTFNELEDIKEVNENIRQSQEVRKTISTEGWRILEDLFKKEIDHFTGLLVMCEDQSKVVRLQEAIKIYRSVINIATAKSLEGDQLQKLLQDQDPESSG